jgi:hypothetical protein
MNEIKKYFNEALLILRKLSQQNDPELSSPEIKIEPMEGLIQQAVNKLKQLDPNYFVGVRKIVVDTGSGLGYVASGKGQDPAIIHLNLPKIKSELQNKNLSKEQLDKEIVRQIALTISHEKGHIKSFKPETGFIGGESPAISEENIIQQKLK